MKNQNLFIIGNPRSGSSLIRIIMDSHPSIVVPPECGFIQWWSSKYNDWNSNDNSSKRIQEFISDLKTSKKIEFWNLNYTHLETLIKIKRPNSYSDLVTLVLLQYALQQGKEPLVFGDKNNYYIDYLSELNTICPEAKYLIIVRDCRDVVCSYLKVNELDSNSQYKPNFPSEIKDISLQWRDNNTKILNFTDKLDPSHFVIIRYEDLLSKPEKTLKSCTALLGLDFDESMLNYYKKQSEPTEFLDWKKKTNQKIDKNNTGAYKKQLSNSQSEEIVHNVKDLMNKFGYV